MTQILDLYERLTQAPDERARARVIAEAFAELEARYPHLSDLATRQHLSETELRLLKEIEQVRAELKETELRLRKEIEQIRSDLKLEIEQVRSELKLEIEQVRSELKLELERTRKELELKIKTVELNLTKAIERSRVSVLIWSFGFWLSQFAAILAILWRVWPQ
nr:hypothetical conserved protein [uncultured Gammaproteobacteria bacterium]